MDLIQKVAKQTGWKLIEHKEDQFMFRFKKGKDSLIDVWYSKMTVCTIITHPTRGRGQMYRRNVFLQKDLVKLFVNPRTHTGEGYYGGGKFLTEKQAEKKVCKNCGHEVD